MRREGGCSRIRAAAADQERVAVAAFVAFGLARCMPKLELSCVRDTAVDI